MPVLLLTRDRWDSLDTQNGTNGRSRESAEMRTVQSLMTSGSKEQDSRAEHRKRQLGASSGMWGEAEANLFGIHQPANMKASFCDWLIGAVQVATSYRDDINELIERRKASGV